jgi:iron complex transport system ATP-binding protein
VSVLSGRGLAWAVRGSRIVDGVDLDVSAGEVLALVGPNGAGKSSVLRLLAGEVEPTSGTVELAGVRLERLGPIERARLRAVMPQDTPMRFSFTVREVVEMGRYSQPSREDDGRAVERALRTVGVEHLALRTFPSLSGGERALVTLARVLAQETPMLLLDEPTASLDLGHQEHVMRVVRALAADGAAVLVVLHDLNLAAAHADRVALLCDGRVVHAGPPWETLSAGRVGDAFGHPVDVLSGPGGAPLIVPARGDVALDPTSAVAC